MPEIIVRTQTEKRISVSISEEDTVNSLKETIEKEEQIPAREQNLSYKGVELTDGNKLLKDINIIEGTEINLQIRTRGVEFSMPNIEEEKTRKLGDNPYHFWYIGGGLNYGGKCLNAECIAYDEPVMYHRGYGIEIEPNKDQHIKEIVRCPGCDHTFDVDKFFLIQCDVTITYKRAEDKKAKDIKKHVFDEAWELGSDEPDHKIKYVYLGFDVKELKQV